MTKKRGLIIPPFDMHAPFDAPLRYRERQEELAREKADAALRDPKVQRKLRKIVREAYAKVKAAGR